MRYVELFSGVDHLRGFVWYASRLDGIWSERLTGYHAALKDADARAQERGLNVHDCSDKGSFLSATLG